MLVKRQGTGDGAGRMVQLFARSAKQDVQGISDDFGDRTIMSKYDVGHSCEVLIEERSQHLRFETLDQGGKTCDVRKKARDLPPLTAEINGFRIVGKPLGQVGRKVSRQ